MSANRLPLEGLAAGLNDAGYREFIRASCRTDWVRSAASVEQRTLTSSQAKRPQYIRLQPCDRAGQGERKPARNP